MRRLVAALHGGARHAVVGRVVAPSIDCTGWRFGGGGVTRRRADARKAVTSHRTPEGTPPAATPIARSGDARAQSASQWRPEKIDGGGTLHHCTQEQLLLPGVGAKNELVGRGASINPANPFESFHVEEDPAAVEELRRVDPEWEPPAPKTAFFVDDTQTLITKNSSPDLSFDASLNPYRGCEHGCSYCYARKFHEFLGFSSGLDFETKIMVKPRAPELLRAEMSRMSWKPTKLALSGVTDCYQPVERKLRITRGCLEVLAEFRNPVVVITKNHLVTRDADVLAELARWQCAAVLISITTLDRDLAATMEPRASGPAMRLRAIRTLANAGIPVGVSVAPVIPGLNDAEIAPILEAARDAGAQFATYSLVRLQGTVADVFAEWLQRNVSPVKKDTILARIRESHGGRLSDSRPGLRMTGEGERAAQIGHLFRLLSQRLGFEGARPNVVATNFRRREPGQLELGL